MVLGPRINQTESRNGYCDPWARCYICVALMKVATVRELRNRYTQLLKWLEAGEEIKITRRGLVIARLIPEKRPSETTVSDWEDSAAFALDRLKLKPLTQKQVNQLLDDNKGSY
jgi:antitoxin (DNA-binding transcriptional repressor) of toxin-antitoxin stability system